jgi:glycosyltransferase involved in cell wall biosynthesis
MKILRVIARLNVGGPARHVVWLSEGLQRAGHETILVTGVVPAGEDDMNYFAEAAGIHPVTIRQMSREISLNDLFAAWKIYRLMLRERPDIVHTHTAKAGAVGRVAGMIYRWLTPAALIGKPRRCRFVHTYHGHVFHSYYGPAKTRVFLGIERLLARSVTDRIVTVSEQQREEINDRFQVGRRDQFEVIPLGLDLNVFSDWKNRRGKMRSELRASDNELLIGIVGRLTEVKNHELFLRGAARLQELVLTGKLTARPRFVIIGDGGLRSSLESKTQELGLTDDVFFLGTRNDPENFYPALDVVALTSVNEGTPLTLIEAMANERPVIASAVGGVVDLLGPRVSEANGYTICERGISFRSNDDDGFAKGLVRLLTDETLRAQVSTAGRDFVRANYGKDRLIRDISNLYERLLAE